MGKDTESKYPFKGLSGGKSLSERCSLSLAIGEMHTKMQGKISAQLSECTKWKIMMSPSAFLDIEKSDHLQ